MIDGQTLLYLVDIFCHLVDLFSSRHFFFFNRFFLLQMCGFDCVLFYSSGFSVLRLIANRNSLEKNKDEKLGLVKTGRRQHPKLNLKAQRKTENFEEIIQ